MYVRRASILESYAFMFTINAIKETEKAQSVQVNRSRLGRKRKKHQPTTNANVRVPSHMTRFITGILILLYFASVRNQIRPWTKICTMLRGMYESKPSGGKSRVEHLIKTSFFPVTQTPSTTDISEMNPDPKIAKLVYCAMTRSIENTMKVRFRL